VLDGVGVGVGLGVAVGGGELGAALGELLGELVGAGAVGLGDALVLGAGDAAGAFFVRTREAESRRYARPEFDSTTSMRRPVWPDLATGSPTLTFIHPELSLNEVVAVSVVPPTAVSLSEPVMPALEPGLTQIVTVSVSPAVTVVVTVWLIVWPPAAARAYLPPRALVFGPSRDALDPVHPDALPSKEADFRGMAVPAGAAGSAG
jgi:hypothetical protein